MWTDVLLELSAVTQYYLKKFLTWLLAYNSLTFLHIHSLHWYTLKWRMILPTFYLLVLKSWHAPDPDERISQHSFIHPWTVHYTKHNDLYSGNMWSLYLIYLPSLQLISIKPINFYMLPNLNLRQSSLSLHRSIAYLSMTAHLLLNYGSMTFVI